MKKRYALLLTGLLTLSLAAGCGAKTDNAGETSAPAVSESQAAESTEQTADVQNTADQGEEKTIHIQVKSQRLIHLMELLFLLKSSKIIQLKRMMKERYHSVPLFFFGNVPIYTKYFDMSYIKPYNRQG